MNGHVTLKIVMPREFLAANGALIRLFLGMRHHVGFQSLVLGEKGATHIAIELSERREGNYDFHSMKFSKNLRGLTGEQSYQDFCTVLN